MINFSIKSKFGLSGKIVTWKKKEYELKRIVRLKA